MATRFRGQRPSLPAFAEKQSVAGPWCGRLRLAGEHEDLGALSAVADARFEGAIALLRIADHFRKVVIRVLEGDALRRHGGGGEIGRRPSAWLGDINEMTAALDD